MKRYVILGNEESISSDLRPHEPDFFNADISVDGPISLKKITRQAVHELERKIILKVLQHHHWNRKQAARALNISYRALLYKIRDAGLPSNRTPRRPQPEEVNVVNPTVAAD
jgi:two-component system response regulator AtoC